MQFSPAIAFNNARGFKRPLAGRRHYQRRITNRQWHNTPLIFPQRITWRPMDDLHIVDGLSGADVSRGRLEASTDPARLAEVVEQTPRFDPRRLRIVRPSLHGSRIAHPRDRLWLAKIQDHEVGAIGILHEQPHVARLSCFRVQPEWQQTPVSTRLVEQVHHYCWNEGYLKLVVPSNVAPCVLQQMIDHRGFQLVRRKRSGPAERLEYLVDLYYMPRRAS